MQNLHIVEAVDRYLEDITKKTSIFGGIQVLFGSNWAQILHIVPDGGGGEIVNACLCHSYIWLHLKVHFLIMNMSAVEAQTIAYTSWLGNMSVDKTQNIPLQLPLFFQVCSHLYYIISDTFPDD
jgi:hypothetical protein